tara:strand:- start:99 stop:323 length:225 start_codon:yes stop_codon:yes gene_type:complete
VWTTLTFFLIEEKHHFIGIGRTQHRARDKRTRPKPTLTTTTLEEEEEEAREGRACTRVSRRAKTKETTRRTSSR